MRIEKIKLFFFYFDKEYLISKQNTINVNKRCKQSNIFCLYAKSTSILDKICKRKERKERFEENLI